MKIVFSLDGIEVNEDGTMASCDRLHAFSIANAIMFQLACTDRSQPVAPIEEAETFDPNKGERLPPRP